MCKTEKKMNHVFEVNAVFNIFYTCLKCHLGETIELHALKK